MDATVVLSSPSLLTPTVSSSRLSLAEADSSASSASKTIQQVGIRPAPVIRVSSDAGELPTNTIESPFIEITQQVSENTRTPLPQTEQPELSNQRLLQDLETERQDIQQRQQQLTNEETAIEREISQLKQREIEINRKKVQLIQQDPKGSLINLSV